jgi:hypothetical protein
VKNLTYICRPSNHHTDITIPDNQDPVLQIVCWQCMTFGLLNYAKLVYMEGAAYEGITVSTEHSSEEN